MTAAEWARKAAETRAAYVALAEAVARGDRGADPTHLGKLAEAAGRAEYEGRKQARRETWGEWRPPSAPHVLGRWTLRVLGDDGMPEEQQVAIVCEHCKAEYKRPCTSGLVKSHVQRFAIVHAHPERKAAPAKKVMGS